MLPTSLPLMAQLTNLVGRLLPAPDGIDIVPLDMARDYSGIDRLVVAEGWPLDRADFEVSHAQPRSVALVARSRANDEVVGFFTTHHFGDVGYLDMMVVDSRYRKVGLARSLYLNTMAKLHEQGMNGYVVHTTNDATRLIRLLGFRAGAQFTLLGRDPQTTATANPTTELQQAPDVEPVIALDAALFGRERREWIEALAAQPDVHFLGRAASRGDRLDACLCLRPRRNGAYCIDQVNTRDPQQLAALIHGAVNAYQDRRLECFARTGSELERLLRDIGFTVPEFFEPIGPLTEWRQGDTGDLGTCDRIQCLTWL